MKKGTVPVLRGYTVTALPVCQSLRQVHKVGIDHHEDLVLRGGGHPPRRSPAFLGCGIRTLPGGFLYPLLSPVKSHTRMLRIVSNPGKD